MNGIPFPLGSTASSYSFGPFVVTGKCDLCGKSSNTLQNVSISAPANVFSTVQLPGNGSSTSRMICPACANIIETVFTLNNNPNAAQLVLYTIVMHAVKDVCDTLSKHNNAGIAAMANIMPTVLSGIIGIPAAGQIPPGLPSTPVAPTPVATPYGIIGQCEACGTVTQVKPATYFTHKPSWNLCQSCAATESYMTLQVLAPKCDMCEGAHYTAAHKPSGMDVP
jgi:hypothetical protein